MKKYRIKKIGKNCNNILADLSEFGDSRDFFEGFALNEPTLKERFVLFNSSGGVVISTSPIIKIEEGKLTTVYSVYSIEEIKPISKEEQKELIVELSNSESYDDPYNWGSIIIDSSNYKPNAMEAESKEDDIINTQPHYDNSKGSLYQIAEQRGWNSYQFDICKRIDRALKKGQFEEDLKKTKDLIDLWLREYE